MNSFSGKDSRTMCVSSSSQENSEGVLEAAIHHRNESNKHSIQSPIENELAISTTEENRKVWSYNGRRHQGKRSPKRRKNEESGRIHLKWFVLIGSFYGIMFSSGLLFNMSVLFVEFLDEFQKTKADTSLIQAVCMGVFACSGLVTGSMIGKLGERKGQALGALLAASGIGSSFFANDIPFLVCSIGIVGGIGFSFIYISSYSIAPKHFEGRQKFLSLGFISIASGVGGLLFPVLLERLLVTYHWREILLIMSGFILNIIIFAMIGKPFNFPKVCKKETHLEPKIEQSSKISTTAENNVEKSLITKFKAVLSNKTFICFAIGMMLSLPCLNSIVIFFIDFYEFNGIERSIGVWLYSGMSIASTLSRPLPGFLAQNPRIPKLAIPASFVFVGIIVVFLFSFAKSVEYLAVLSCTFGICYGGVIVALPVNTFDIIGQENYATAFGIVMAGTGIINIVGGPALGLLRDLTGTYDISLYVSCGSLTCSFLLLLISVFCIKEKSSKNYEYEIEIRRKSRRSSIFPWKQSLQVTTIQNTRL